MDKFVVSARKYRPQNFDSVIGQNHITTTLKNAIVNQHLAHAFLFCGPRGVGKTTCARILAKTINCTNLQPDGEACNTCNSCKSFYDGSSLNIHELDAASNNSVDDIRLLVEQVRFTPQAGKYKVYIVDEVHMLSSSAFNAFLKTLEEPPAHAIFILATTEKHKILPTILSRCQIFDFKRITLNDTVDFLADIAQKEHIAAEKGALQVIAQKSEGCMRDALSILDKIVSFTNGQLTYANTLENLNLLDEDYFFKLLDAFWKNDMAEALVLFDEINYKGFEGDLVLNGFANFIRNLLVCKNAKAAHLLDVVENLVPRFTEKASQLPLSYLVSMLSVLNESEIQYKSARNKRLHVEVTFIKLSYLQQAIVLAKQENQVVSKKRQIDKPIPVYWEKIQTNQPTTNRINATSNTKQDSSLWVDKSIQIQPKNQTTEIKSSSQSVITQDANKATIHATSTPAASTTLVHEPITEAEKAASKLTLFESLKKKIGIKYEIVEVRDAIPLNYEQLKQVIDEYVQELDKNPAKKSCVHAFKEAELSIVDDNNFLIKSISVTTLKFIEAERPHLLEKIFNAFNNRAIKMLTDIRADENKLPDPIYFNSRQRFEMLANEYPLVKVLKDALKFDIDNL